MVQPGREDAVGAQLAAVLVLEDVVGIVGALAVVAEAAERRAVGEAAGEGADAAVGAAGGARQHRVEVGADERPHAVSAPSST